MTGYEVHAVGEDGVWYGGIGHRMLSMDPVEEGGPQGVECFRCGMAAEPDAVQELIPDCMGSGGDGTKGGGDHHWQAAFGRSPANECAYGDARVEWETPYSEAQLACVRA